MKPKVTDIGKVFFEVYDPKTKTMIKTKVEELFLRGWGVTQQGEIIPIEITHRRGERK